MTTGTIVPEILDPAEASDYREASNRNDVDDFRKKI
jgi:hypothetical protein